MTIITVPYWVIFTYDAASRCDFTTFNAFEIGFHVSRIAINNSSNVFGLAFWAGLVFLFQLFFLLISCRCFTIEGRSLNRLSLIPYRSKIFLRKYTRANDTVAKVRVITRFTVNGSFCIHGSNVGRTKRLTPYPIG